MNFAHRVTKMFREHEVLKYWLLLDIILKKKFFLAEWLCKWQLYIVQKTKVPVFSYNE